MKPENAAELLAQPDVDGALVGGASLDPASFAAICRAAAQRERERPAARHARDPRRLGPRAAGAGERRRARAHTGVRRPRATVPVDAARASGAAVGLPDGQMGNSEVGHLTIGSGRILYQDLVRVNRAVEDGSIFENAALARRLPPDARARAARCTCSGSSRPAASTRTSTTCARCSSSPSARGWRERTWVHAFTDGRDVSPRRRRSPTSRRSRPSASRR